MILNPQQPRAVERRSCAFYAAHAEALKAVGPAKQDASDTDLLGSLPGVGAVDSSCPIPGAADAALRLVRLGPRR